MIIDDRANEIADVIVINEPGDHGRHITLVHCKFSKERKPGARVEDLYEVLGQAGRFVVWLDPARMAARLPDRLSTGSKVTAGDPDELIATLTDWTSSTVPVRWSIAIAQPAWFTPMSSSKRAQQTSTASNCRSTAVNSTVASRWLG